MIQLIATDLDGTLLDDEKRIPDGFFDAVKKLRERGVRLAIASGRQYFNLAKLFAPIREELLFLCENGSILFDDDRNIGYHEIPHDKLVAPLQAAKAIPTVHPILCGVDCAYTASHDLDFLHNASLYYERCRVVSDPLTAAERDRICKIAFFDSAGAEESALPGLNSFADDFTIAPAGKNWLDFMLPGVNKGTAIRRIQQELKITPEETMAFGDYLNDVELMKNCGYSYAMVNAHPGLRAVCRYATDSSNNEDGVMRVLRREFPFLSE